MKYLYVLVAVAGFVLGAFVLPHPDDFSRTAHASHVAVNARSEREPIARAQPASWRVVPHASRSHVRKPVVHVAAPVAVGDVWLRLKGCEAGIYGWHANTGNGFYGAFQIMADNAAHYGFARPDLLSPAEQVRLARLVLRDQGVNAWPVCGPRVGLTRNS